MRLPTWRWRCCSPPRGTCPAPRRRSATAPGARSSRAAGSASSCAARRSRSSAPGASAAPSRAAPRAFGMEVELVGRDDDLHAALTRADVVSLHCPLTPATHHLIDAPALAAMKRSAILVNTARGPVVDQAALVSALRDGTIAAAALDVTDPEPPAPGDPLLAAPNLLLLPHIGSATHAARERMADRAGEQSDRRARGRADALPGALLGPPAPARDSPDP